MNRAHLCGVSSSEIDLTWTDNAANETGFIVERSPDGVSEEPDPEPRPRRGFHR